MDLVYTFFYLLGDPLNFIPDNKYNTITNLMVKLNQSGNQFIKDENLNKLGKFNEKDYPEYVVRFKKNHNSGKKRYESPRFSQKKYEEAIKEGSLFGLGYFPWNTKLTPVDDGTFIGIAPHAGAKIKWQDLLSRNPYSGHNLTIKLKTIGILGVSFLVLWHGIPLFLKLIGLL